MNELAARNIIGGYPDGTFKPGNSITRGQAAAIIAKMIGLDTSDVKGKKFKDVPASHGFYKAIVKMAEEGIIGGIRTAVSNRMSRLSVKIWLRFLLKHLICLVMRM